MRILENADEHSLIETFAVSTENLASPLSHGASARRVVIIRGEGLDPSTDEVEGLVSR
jgi:hypothetical protein